MAYKQRGSPGVSEREESDQDVKTSLTGTVGHSLRSWEPYRHPASKGFGGQTPARSWAGRRRVPVLGCGLPLTLGCPCLESGLVISPLWLCPGRLHLYHPCPVVTKTAMMVLELLPHASTERLSHLPKFTPLPGNLSGFAPDLSRFRACACNHCASHRMCVI